MRSSILNKSASPRNCEIQSKWLQLPRIYLGRLKVLLIAAKGVKSTSVVYRVLWLMDLSQRLIWRQQPLPAQLLQWHQHPPPPQQTPSPSWLM